MIPNMIPAWFCQSPRIQTPPLSHLWDHRFKFIKSINHDNLLPQLLINGPDLWRLHKEESEEVRSDGQSVDNIHGGLASRVMKTMSRSASISPSWRPISQALQPDGDNTRWWSRKCRPVIGQSDLGYQWSMYLTASMKARLGLSTGSPLTSWAWGTEDLISFLTKSFVLGAPASSGKC